LPISAVAGNDSDIWNLEESASQNHPDSVRVLPDSQMSQAIVEKICGSNLRFI